MPLRRAVESAELFVAAESPGAVHRDEALAEGRKRQSSLERWLVTQTALGLRLIDACHDHRNRRRAARRKVVRKPARRRRGQEEGCIESVGLRESEIEVNLPQRFQPFQRVAHADAADDLLPGGETVLHQSIEQRVLVSEMAIERHRRQLCPLRHPADGETLQPMRFEQGLGGREYAILGHAYTVHWFVYAVHIQNTRGVFQGESILAHRVLVLYGSYRSDRRGIRLADYLVRALRSRGEDVELIDAKAVGLPMLDRMFKEYEPGRAPEAMASLAAKIRLADAFVFVVGEYNWGVQPGLKNLTDHYLEEWFWRPAAIASYSGGRLSGARSSFAWHNILAEMGMAVISSTLSVGPVGATLNEAGEPIGDAGAALERAFVPFADDLAWWTEAARAQRQRQAPPY